MGYIFRTVDRIITIGGLTADYSDARGNKKFEISSVIGTGDCEPVKMSSYVYSRWHWNRWL
jgi:hypothetical protein